jgi:adenosylhomocysteine nucleosidase
MQPSHWCAPLRVGFVTGLAAEARVAARLGMAEAGGGMPAGAAAAAERLLARGATALVSFGLCGGLDPALAPGDLVVSARVIGEGLHALADPALSQALGGGADGATFAATGPVATATGKAALAARGAVAVDLESGEVARAALRASVPFAVLRAVCDPAGFDLPPAALLALGADGRIAAGPLARSLLARPSQIPALLRLARAAAAARAALLRRVGDVGRGAVL